MLAYVYQTLSVKLLTTAGNTWHLMPKRSHAKALGRKGLPRFYRIISCRAMSL